MNLPIVARAALIVVFATSGVYCLLRCARWSLRQPLGRGQSLGRGQALGRGQSGRQGCHTDGHGEHGRVSDLAQVAMSVAMVAMLATGSGGDRWGVQLTVFAVAAGWFLTRALPAVGHAARAGPLHHAVMMGGMFWMSFTMTRAAPMAMAGMAAAVGPVTVASLAIAGYLAVASVWWGRRSIVTAGGGGGLFGVTGATTCHAVTSAGMATLFVLSVVARA